MQGFISTCGSGRVSLINVNTADPLVLKAAAVAAGSPDTAVCESLVAKIVQFRESNAFTNTGKIASAPLALSSAERGVLTSMARFLGVSSAHFGGTAWGRKSDTTVASRRVDFVFDRSTGGIEYWHED
jgi:hypothetical protein